MRTSDAGGAAAKPPAQPPRRRTAGRRAGLLRKAAAGALAGGVALLAFSTHAAEAATYRLDIERATVDITGKPLRKITLNGGIPGPVLRFVEGEEAVVTVVNHLDEPSSVHWHGLLLPGVMDGVPGLNGFPGIAPGATFVYRFPVRQSGTYWYHAHSKGQEQDGHYGALVIEPRAAGSDRADRADRDYVVLLSDFHEEDSGEIMRNLKRSAEHYQNNRRTLGDFFRDAREAGFGEAWRAAREWGRMRMMPTDLADVTGYSFLVNGRPPERHWTGVFAPGERVRLRFINASAMTFYDVRIPGLKMQVVAADGQNVEPVEVDEFRFGVAETYDVIVAPQEDRAYAIAAESIDRTGFALGALAPRAGMRVSAPPPRPRALLTMADMGMAHGGHAAHGAAHEAAPGGAEHAAAGHDAAAHAGMEHAAGGHGAAAHADMEHAAGGHGASAHADSAHVAAGHDASAHADSESAAAGRAAAPASGWARAGTPPGHKALAYSDLRYRGVQADTRAPAREIVVRLGGNMERYIWTLNGVKYEHAEPLQLEYGERVRLRFVNDTMMAHPMHLHGMFVQLDNGQPAAKLPNKHTVIVPPGQSYAALLTADEPGEWALHCHLLYHMSAGMMNEVVVAKTVPPPREVYYRRESRAAPPPHDSQLFYAATLEAAAGEDDDGRPVVDWELEGWLGGDKHKLRLEAEGERADRHTEAAEFRALYSRAVTDFWDAQIGLRHDAQPRPLAHLVAGVEGLAPYFVETKARLFLSEDGDASARLRVEKELLVTQVFVLEPYLEANLYAQDVRELDAGAGLADAELGVAAHYALTRKFAPYAELRYARLFGETAGLARRHGEPRDAVAGLLGLRLVF